MAGFSNQWGYRNIFLGSKAGYTNISGWGNVFIGTESGYKCSSGYSNICFGDQSGYSLTSGWSNIFIGGYAGYSVTNGSQNLYIGINAGLWSNSTRNLCIGANSGFNSAGNENTFVGINSAVNNSSGSGNVCIGDSAGYNSTGSGNIFVGNSAGYSEGTSNKLYIENSAAAAPLIGGNFATNRVGINRMPTTYTLEVGGTIWSNGSAIVAGSTTWSDVRYKTNIQTLAGSLNKIKNLRRVSYDWKYGDFPDKNFPQGVQIGVIAQEIEKVLPELVFTDADGFKSVAYEKLTPVLIEAIKEQQKQIEKLCIENASLKTINDKQQTINNELKADIETIKTMLGSSARK